MKLFKAIAAVSLLTVFSCAKEIEIIPVETPEQPVEVKTYTMSVTAGKGGIGTKALSLEGNTLNASWTEDDEVTVYNGADAIGTLTAQSSGTSTKLIGTLSGTINPGDVLTLKYLSDNYSSQDGTLTGNDGSIDNVCDYAVATVTVKAVDDSNNISIKESGADFENQQAIVKFTLKESDEDGTAISGTCKLVVNAGGTAITVTPSSPTNVLYVAIPALEDATLTMEASVNDGTKRTYTKTGLDFAKSSFHEIGVKMAFVVMTEEELNAAPCNGRIRNR